MSRSKIDIFNLGLDNEDAANKKSQKKLSAAVDRKFKRFETVKSKSSARFEQKNNLALNEPPRKKPKFQLPVTTAANAVSQSAILNVEKAQLSPVNSYYEKKFHMMQKKMTQSRNEFFGDGSKISTPAQPDYTDYQNRQIHVELPALPVEKTHDGDAETLKRDEHSMTHFSQWKQDKSSERR